MVAALRSLGHEVNVAGDGEVNVYHAGNNRLHHDIHERAHRKPGVVEVETVELLVKQKEGHSVTAEVSIPGVVVPFEGTFDPETGVLSLIAHKGTESATIRLTLKDGRLDGGAIRDLLDGDLLDGIDPAGAPDFSTWLLVARQRLAGRIDARLREETIVAISRGQYGRAVELAEAAARRVPYDEGAQVLLVRSLAAAGHTRAAVDHVTAVEERFRTELGVEPSAALRSAARSRRSSPTAPRLSSRSATAPRSATRSSESRRFSPSRRSANS